MFKPVIGGGQENNIGIQLVDFDMYAGVSLFTASLGKLGHAF